MDNQPNQPQSSDVIVGSPTRPGDKEERLGGAQSAQPIFAQPVPAPEPTPAPAQNWQGKIDEVAGTTLNQAAPIENTGLKFSAKQDPEPTYTDGKRPDGSDLDKGERLLTAIGYIGILALLPLLLRRDSAYCRHHGAQALVLAAIITITEMIFRLLGIFLIATNAFIIVMIIVTWIVCFIFAFSGNWFKIPGIYGWSRDLNLWAKEMEKGDRLHNQD